MSNAPKRRGRNDFLFKKTPLTFIPRGHHKVLPEDALKPWQIEDGATWLKEHYVPRKVVPVKKVVPLNEWAALSNEEILAMEAQLDDCSPEEQRSVLTELARRNLL